MLSEQYFAEIHRILETVQRTQLEAIQRTAEIIVNTTAQQNNVYVFGSSHAGILAQEVFYRTGGLVTINPILAPALTLDVRPVTLTSSVERLEGYGSMIVDSSNIKSGDLFIIHSVSGRNSVPVEAAIRARQLGATVVALTNVEYSSSVTSRHPSGKRLFEVCDIVIDNCGCYGDSAVTAPGFAEKFAPTSTVIGAAILNAIVASAVEIFIERGIEPPVFVSANLDGGDDYNRIMLDKYRDQIKYM